jgi:F-type H+-transporting ATPase subunit epsilon
MPTLNFELVTADRVVLQEEGVDMVVAPGTDGVLGILPEHVPLITTLQPGEMRVKRGGEETSLLVTGGFMEVTREKVLVLADAAERSEEIDLARAEEARRRAEERLAGSRSEMDAARAEAALRRAMVRIRIGQRRRSSGRMRAEDRG